MLSKTSQVVIESTSRCNLKCRGCYRYLGGGVGEQVDMDMGLYRRILDQVDDWNPKPIIVPFSDGEPLLHPQFHLMLGELRRRNLPYNFSTNGTIWRKDVFDEALDSPLCLSVCVSLDGFQLETIEYYRHPPKDPSETIRKLLTKPRQCDIAVSLTRQGHDFEEIENFVRSWLLLGVDYVIVRNWLSSEVWEGRPLALYPCHYKTGRYLVVKADGQVRLCERNMNSPVIGDLTKETVEEVLPRLERGYRVCDTCGQRYCGEGFYGTVYLKDQTYTEPIYYRQDYFNHIFSRRDVRKGISWQA